MSKLTPKENYMRMARGEMPVSIPVYGYAKMGDKDPDTVLLAPSCLGTYRGPQGGVDPFGVRYVANEETGFASMPDTSFHILDDITKWRDVIKKPDFSDVDWETMAKKDIEALGIDREKTAIMGCSLCEFFQPLMGMMGFVEGLCAIAEEPDEVAELFDMMCDVAVELTKKMLYYYKPDIWNFGDDSATKLNPFISPKQFRELLVPRYKRVTDIVREYDIPIDYHNCGRCEDFLDDMVNVCGISIWNPAQTTNDLLAVKKKFGRKLAVVGGYDFVMPVTYPDVDEEYVRSSVREAIDRYAPGGGYGFCGGVPGRIDDPAVMKINMWIADEVETYGKDYYLR